MAPFCPCTVRTALTMRLLTNRDESGAEPDIPIGYCTIVIQIERKQAAITIIIVVAAAQRNTAPNPGHPLSANLLESANYLSHFHQPGGNDGIAFFRYGANTHTQPDHGQQHLGFYIHHIQPVPA